MTRESSLGGSLLRLTPKGMISFPAIRSREEESFAVGERRLGWNEEGGKQESIYVGVHLVAGVKILSLMAPHEGICEWIEIYMLLSWKSVERVRESTEVKGS
jgi:hypothetical protein